jgi:hypothetical protein
MYPTDIEMDDDVTPRTKKHAISNNPSQMDIDGTNAETHIKPLHAQDLVHMEDFDLDGEDEFQTPLVLRRKKKVVEFDEEPEDDKQVMERKNKVRS